MRRVVIPGLWLPWPVGLELIGQSTSEETTTSTVTADIKSLTLDTPVDDTYGLVFYCNIRKTAGAAVSAQVGLKLNATQASANQAWGSAANQAEVGGFCGIVGPRRTSYLRGGWLVASSGTTDQATGRTIGSNDMPTGGLTTVVITGLVGDAAVTMGVADLFVFRVRGPGGRF